MIPRLHISFPLQRQWQYWFGKQYKSREGEYLLNHARTGIVLALRTALPNGGRVGVVAYNCHTVANAIVQAGCTPVFVDVTEQLYIDVNTVPEDLDAIVVTNLFGIRNDIAAIRKQCPQSIIIVDNAHGYGLPAEGDFTVYSINQGKFPALGTGGILYTTDEYRAKIDDLYAPLPSYGIVAQVKLFVQMMMKAIAYSPCVYWLTMKMKNSSNPNVHQEVLIKKMAPGVRRMYEAWLPNAAAEIAKQKHNAEQICHMQSKIKNRQCIVGDNAFMAIVRCDDPDALQKEFALRGVETATHFKNAITWAKEFDYIPGSCPTAERLTKELLMIPTYRKI